MIIQVGGYVEAEAGGLFLVFDGACVACCRPSLYPL